MNTQMIYSPSDLINKLQYLQEKGGYIFRGHSDARYQLIPSVFRLDILKKNSDRFPVDESTILKWFQNKNLLNEISAWLPNTKITSPLPQIIMRFFRYYVYVMQYNYELHKFLHQHPDSVSPEDIAKLTLRDAGFWTQEKSFQYFITNIFPRLIRRFHLDGTLLQDANPEEDLTGVDETFPQHYGIYTAALDWSHNFLVSLYFTLGSYNSNTPYLSIYAYKEISNNGECPIILLNKSEHVFNLRAERQEGTFTYFTKPCSFYLQHGGFPCIEYYDRHLNNNSTPAFELIRYTLERTTPNLNFIRNLLASEGIDESFLLPSIETKYTQST